MPPVAGGPPPFLPKSGSSASAEICDFTGFGARRRSVHGGDRCTEEIGARRRDAASVDVYMCTCRAPPRKFQVPTYHERPLNERGRRDAARVGKRLAKLGWVPDFVVEPLHSRRTKETWERIQKSFPNARVRFTRVLYAGGP